MPHWLEYAWFIPQFKDSFRYLAGLYQEAVFPDTTFVIGRMNCGGTVDAPGLLIGTEIFSRTPDSPLHELNAWERAVTLPISYLPFIVAHELIHIQQPPEVHTTLLAKCLREGAAEVLGERISGRDCTPALHAYGLIHERELWTRFAGEMKGTDTSGWLYEGAKSVGEPADLGYFIGARVCRAYLAGHQDQCEAVRDLIVRADPEGFLADSGYR